MTSGQGIDCESGLVVILSCHQHEDLYSFGKNDFLLSLIQGYRFWPSNSPRIQTGDCLQFFEIGNRLI